MTYLFYWLSGSALFTAGYLLHGIFSSRRAEELEEELERYRQQREEERRRNAVTDGAAKGGADV